MAEVTNYSSVSRETDGPRHGLTFGPHRQNEAQRHRPQTLPRERQEKLVLPRPRDAVDMMRDVFEKRQPYGASSSYGRELVVIDISNAFMALGVHAEEHPHTLAPSLDEGEFYLFAALLFGYKTAPLLWSRVAALWARIAQSILQRARGAAPDVPRRRPLDPSRRTSRTKLEPGAHPDHRRGTRWLRTT